MVMGYKLGEIRKFLITVAAFLTGVVAVVLEASIGFYGDGEVNTGEWLALAVLFVNSAGVFRVPNDDVDTTPNDDIGDEVFYDLDTDEMGMEGAAIRDVDEGFPPGSRRV